MAAKTKPARVIQFAEIEQRFRLVPLPPVMGTHPAVGRDDGDEGYFARVLVSSVPGTYGGSLDRYAYFRFDAAGVITEAPRGHAKDYRPGRVAVGELEAAVAKYAGAVAR
jgi:hypothetical protein